MTAKAIFQEAVNLDVDERLKLLHDLWGSIKSAAEHTPLTPDELEDLRARAKEHEADPESGIYWDDAKAKLRSRK